MQIRLIVFLYLLLATLSYRTKAQLHWQQVDSLFQPLPGGIHVYKSTDLLDGKPNISYYTEADLRNKNLEFTVDTTLNRRLSPADFFTKNNGPALVVNCTFFEFAFNRNLNAVIKDGKLLAYNNSSVIGHGKDTFTYKHAYASALGISKKGSPDIAWLLTDSSKKSAYARQQAAEAVKDSLQHPGFDYLYSKTPGLKKWKVKTAVGGGPVLVQAGQIKISNNEELKFGGKAIEDKHPRTAMGYTADGKLIILVIQGRFPGIAEGATLTQEARILQDLGCAEALNLDGGGSSCLLVNGKETIKPSDKEGERPVPAVFIVRAK